jgi:hypothetical protein
MRNRRLWGCAQELDAAHSLDEARCRGLIDRPFVSVSYGLLTIHSFPGKFTGFAIVVLSKWLSDV